MIAMLSLLGANLAIVTLLLNCRVSCSIPFLSRSLIPSVEVATRIVPEGADEMSKVSTVPLGPSLS